ncbi:hypothetical protein HOL52_02900 [bacterium]|nr:hypothetical protein [bacterium]
MKSLRTLMLLTGSLLTSPSCTPSVELQDDCIVYNICDDTRSALAGTDIAGVDTLAGTDIAGEDTLAGTDIAGVDTLAGTDIAGEDTLAGSDIAGEDTLAGSDIAGEEILAGSDIAGEDTLAGSDIASEEVVDASCNELGDTICIDKVDCTTQTAADFFEDAEMQMVCLRINSIEDATVSLDYDVNVFSQFPQNISYVLDGSVVHSNSDSELPVKGGQYFNSSQDLFLSAGTHTFRLVHQTNGELDDTLPINSSDTVKSVLNIANSSYTYEDIYSTFEDRAYVTVFEENGSRKVEITSGGNSETAGFMILLVHSFVTFEFNYFLSQNGITQDLNTLIEPGVTSIRIPQFYYGDNSMFSFFIPDDSSNFATWVEINPTFGFLAFDVYIYEEYGYYGNPIKLIHDSERN